MFDLWTIYMKINHVSSPDFSFEIFIGIHYLIGLESFLEYSGCKLDEF